MSDAEFADLKRKVAKTTFSREAYIRSLIRGVVPKDKPPPDYFKMVQQLHAIGNNLNQVAQTAHVFKRVDAARFFAEVDKLAFAIQEIRNAVQDPEESEVI